MALLLPKVLATVVAKCSYTDRTYAMVFEKTGSSPWVLRRTETSTLPTDESGAEISLQEIAWDQAEADPCPYCTNEALIQCASCGRLSCHLGAEKGAMTRCAWCGVGGRIEDYIRQLEGKQRL